MGGDNFNKKNRESGNDSKSDASKLMAAINAGKKHRESTPGRLEKEAEKLLNSIVDQFIVESDMYSKIEKAATEGFDSIVIGVKDLTKLFPTFDGDYYRTVTGFFSDFSFRPFGENKQRTILVIHDKGGSGLSSSRTVDDFIKLITKKFSEVAHVSKADSTWYSKRIDASGNGMFRISWDDD
jgi:hypothetical protein